VRIGDRKSRFTRIERMSYNLCTETPTAVWRAGPTMTLA